MLTWEAIEMKIRTTSMVEKLSLTKLECPSFVGIEIWLDLSVSLANLLGRSLDVVL